MPHLVAKQHRLPSVQWLLSEISRVGLCSRVTLVTKPYSAIPFSWDAKVEFLEEVASDDLAFQQSAEKPFMVLDEGGGLHAAIPPELTARCAGVEQTTFGLQTDWKYPTVLVCRSAAKLFFESQIIARGILRKLDSLQILPGMNVGVIGLGALGADVARALLNRGVQTLGSEIGATPADLRSIIVSVDELLARCDVLLGCTGTDVFANVNLGTISGRKILLSCSSSDVEFRSVLRQLPAYDCFGTAQGWIGRLHATVLNGGYPINFDRMREWELFEEIILTRKLILEGMLQARSLIGQQPRGVMLNPAVQLRVVNEWLEQVPERDKLRIPEPLDEAFFLKHSEGDFEMSNKPYTLHSTTPDALVKMRAHVEPYSFEVMGMPILVLPNVWSPAHDWSSLFYLEHFPQVKELDFLEIGCGTGVISAFAAHNGARKVVAVDVNPDAVRNAQLNFERFGVENAEAHISDVFSNVRGVFDIVTWNAPYHGSKPADVLERGCTDEDYRDIRGFFRDVSQHLKPGGLVVFGFSESGDLSLLETLIADHGLRIKRKLSDWRQGYNCMLFELLRGKK
jgi:release factor glutamine methyltransferase